MAAGAPWECFHLLQKLATRTTAMMMSIDAARQYHTCRRAFRQIDETKEREQAHDVDDVVREWLPDKTSDLATPT